MGLTATSRNFFYDIAAKLHLITRFTTLHRKAQMAYPASFYMMTLSYFFSICIDLTGILALFERFGQIGGWTWSQLALLYGIMHMSFGTAELFGRGFDTLSQVVRMGEFDRILLRPCSPFLQVALREFQWMRMGRVLQGACVLAWSLYSLKISLFSWEFTLLACSFIGTTSVFYGLLVVQATISFWTIESLELMNIATHGGLELGQFPMSIYPKELRAVFMCAIPIGTTAYLPIAVLMGHHALPTFVAFLAPALGVVFLLLTYLFWCKGVRHYSSTGS